MGRIIRAIFGENSTIAPLYVVMAGGVFLLIAAGLVTFVTDVADETCRKKPCLKPIAHELFTVPEGVQPVPSTGLIDEIE